jgi:ferritin-like metal-binding protein YciE
MNSAHHKIIQYLSEARAGENALVRVLQSQIAVTPTGSYRSALDKHLNETRRHRARIDDRLRELDAGANPIMVAVGFWEDVVGQALALGTTPLHLLRGSGGEEKVLKNAKDACATEALEIATYTALERLARAVGDDQTAELAESIRSEEQAMLERVLREIPKLTDAVVGADVNGNGSYDIATTGAGEAVREAGEATRRAARKTTAATRRTARQARKIPGVAQVEGEIKGAVAGEDDLAIANYDSLNVDEISGRLTHVSQIDLAKIDAYERRHENRTTILSRITSLRGDEPWAGYDELTASEIQTVLAGGDEDLVRRARTYERSHKNRAGVMRVAERELASA